ncbi:MAG: hypothetical protein LBR29_03765 [Methylobacteriaceae bacterium]|jgi:ZIP family zinc transporter|nr:hypothetical protein [Methylobacteriaceae bacterium]
MSLLDFVPSSLLTLGAALSLCLGAWLAFFVDESSGRFSGLTSSLSAGIMLTLGASMLLEDFAPLPVGLFVAGALATAALLHVSHHHAHHASSHSGAYVAGLSAAAVAAHSFPECFALFSAAMVSLPLGLALAAAMVMHHIPLGLSVAAPMRAEAGGLGKSLKYTALAGFAPAALAVLTYAFSHTLFSPDSLEPFLAFAGGILVCIAVIELLPGAWRVGKTGVVGAGFAAGAAVMSTVLLVAGLWEG